MFISIYCRTRLDDKVTPATGHLLGWGSIKCPAKSHSTKILVSVPKGTPVLIFTTLSYMFRVVCRQLLDT